MGYWEDRMSKAQDKLTQKRADEIQKQIEKYYSSSMRNVINSFVRTYEKILGTVEDGKEPTPADLYKLDTYWKMSAQLRDELQKLGNKQMVLFSKAFEEEFLEIYNSISLPSQATYSTISKETITQMINAIWAADGKSWSERIWSNNARLADTLNEGLLHCVLTGKNTNDLKKILRDRFNVSYNRADTLVRTELGHIQTQAAHKRYTDAGVSEFEVWASKDERRCEVCGKLHMKKYPIYEKPPIPAHPNCRCTILPVI